LLLYYIGRNAYLSWLKKHRGTGFDVLLSAATRVFNEPSYTGIISSLSLKESFNSFLDSRAYTEWCKRQLGSDLNLLSSEIQITLSNFNQLCSETDVNADVHFPMIDSPNASGSDWFRPFSIYFENIPATVYLTVPSKDEGFPIVYISKFVEDAAGYSRNDLLGKENIFIKGAPDKMIGSFVDGIPSVHTHNISHADGTSVPVTVVSKPIYDSRSTEYRYMLSIQLEKRLTEEDLRIIVVLILFIPSMI
jgi:hypothetical protein